ncbi:hypothetical protein B5V01_06110 [Mesorhizobium erdmanii]|uniref:Uncharacterized protein n=2 Tax=Mesorhizobium TaxID=68287 RepID=A0A3M9X974_9HYPH|nr:hypothetical protein DNR46_17620 [Mesorhizobium japonicum]RXT49467.1 hypothetical protein B5V01_06110 [Mesorhizobium erdmanii]
MITPQIIADVDFIPEISRMISFNHRVIAIRQRAIIREISVLDTKLDLNSCYRASPIAKVGRCQEKPPLIVVSSKCNVQPSVA